MGIQGLIAGLNPILLHPQQQQQLHQNHQNGSRNTNNGVNVKQKPYKSNITEFSGQTIAVDASSWLFKGM